MTPFVLSIAFVWVAAFLLVRHYGKRVELESVHAFMAANLIVTVFALLLHIPINVCGLARVKAVWDSSKKPESTLSCKIVKVAFGEEDQE